MSILFSSIQTDHAAPSRRGIGLAPWSSPLDSRHTNHHRLRQTDVKAGHFERKVQALEAERDQWETKYEDMSKKYAALQKELEDLQNEIGNI